MRLKRLEQVLKDAPVPDVVRVIAYSSELFGQPFSTAIHEVLWSPSDWSRGERELFAAFVSSKNQCLF